MAGRLRYLDSMRAVAIVMVVAIHAKAAVTFSDPGLAQLVDFIIYPAAVPVFFLVDGFLLAKKYNAPNTFDYNLFLGKSFARLVIPWLAFTILYTLARWGFETAGILSEKQLLEANLTEILLAAYGSVYAPQLYFLLSLFFIRLTAPLWIAIFRWDKKPLLAAFLAFLLLYKSGINYLVPYLEIKGGQEPLLHALWGLQFYFLGGVAHAWNMVKTKKFFLASLLLFAGAVILKGELRISFMPLVIQYLYLITFFSLFASFTIHASFLDRLGRNTMGIYLLHAPILIKGFSLVLSRVLHDSLHLYLGIVLTTTLLSYFLTGHLRRSSLTAWLLGE